MGRRNQICAIGLAIQKMTSLHGIAINVSTALDYDRVINPCGLTDRGLTSISNEVGRNLTIDEVAPVVGGAIQEVFELSLVPRTLAELGMPLARAS